MTTEQTSAEESERPWLDYLNAETDLLLEQAGRDLVIAMVHSRAIEDPELYANSDRRKRDLSQAHFGITKAGYWERIALRALVLLRIPEAEREARIGELAKEAKARSEAARARLRSKLKKGPKVDKTLEVDITKLRL